MVVTYANGLYISMASYNMARYKTDTTHINVYEHEKSVTGVIILWNLLDLISSNCYDVCCW